MAGKQNWIRSIVGGLSFTTALFVFQACYGTVQDFEPDMLIEGQVKSKTSGLPITGIKVSALENGQYEITDPEGRFSFYTWLPEALTIKFEDIDSVENGYYMDADTVLTDYSESVRLDILMESR